MLQCSQANGLGLLPKDVVGEIKGDTGLPIFTTLIKLQLLCSKKL